MVCGKEAQYSEIIATSANQIVPPFRNSADLHKNVVLYFARPPFPIAVLKGGLGTRLTVIILLMLVVVLKAV